MKLGVVPILVALATQVIGGDFDDFVTRKAKYEERSRIRREAYFANAKTDESIGAKTTSEFLNSRTKKFAVNGKALPLVDFDIGESYSGLIPIDSTGRELFFWFFPTQGSGKNDITIWLNGGPGCSSLEGLFEENGPFVWQPGTYGPRKNPFSLNKLSNVVYVEQPVGTGFSQGKPNATNEVEVGRQFDGFWKNFVDIFGLHNFNIYITGESYAGQYVPYIGDAFLEAGGKKYHNLKGISIYDPVIGPEEMIEPAAVPFAHYNYASLPFDAATWAHLDKLQKECGYDAYMKQGLTFPPKGHLPKLNVTQRCDTYDAIYNLAGQFNPCFNIYHVSETCPTEADILEYGGSGYDSRISLLRKAYFDRDDVRKVIHAPLKGKWTECSNDVLRTDNSPGSGTANGPIARIAEKVGNVIVGHALNDYILLANQTLLTLNNLVWNGKQGFDEAPNKPMFIPQSHGRSQNYVDIGSWTKSRGVTFVEVKLSGHMIPQYNPRADFRIQEVLHGRVKSLSAKVPFTN